MWNQNLSLILPDFKFSHKVTLERVLLLEDERINFSMPKQTGV